MNRWLNPPPIKFENEFSPQDYITQPLFPFGHYTRQIGKKKVSRKSKKERLVDKSLNLSKRITKKELV